MPTGNSGRGDGRGVLVLGPRIPGRRSAAAMTVSWVTLSESEPTHANRGLPPGEDAVGGEPVRIGRFDAEPLRDFSDGLAAPPDDDFRHNYPLTGRE